MDSKGLLSGGAPPAAFAAPAVAVVATPVAYSASALPNDSAPILSSDEVVEGKMMRAVTMERGYNDVKWAVLFGVGVLATFGAGAFIAADVVNKGADLKSCLDGLDGGGHLNANAQQSLKHYKDKWAHSDAFRAAHPNNSTGGSSAADITVGTLIGDIVFAVIFAFCIGAGFLFVIEKEARIVTWMSVCSLPAFSGLIGIWVSTWDGGSLANYGTYNALFWCLIIYVLRARVELTAEILRMSATAFKENTGLVATTGATSVLAIFLLIIPLCVFTYFVAFPRDLAQTLAHLDCGDLCFPAPMSVSDGMDADNDYSPSPPPPPGSYTPPPPPHHNSYSPSPPPASYRLFADVLQEACPNQKHSIQAIASYGNYPNPGLTTLLGFMILWVSMLSTELRVSSVAGCIGLHYFEASELPNGRSRSLQGLVWSLTTSFGTLCYSSFVLTLIRIADWVERAIIESFRENSNIGVKIVGEILHCLWRYIRVYLEYITKMAVIAGAITAEPFCPAAKKAHKMTVRHNFDGLGVDGFAGFTLFMLSLASGLVIGLVAYALDGSDMASSKGWTLGLVSFLVCQMVAGIVLVISNTHYFCYTLDLDHSYAPAGRTQHIHELYGRALAGQMARLKASKKWKNSPQYKREAAAQQGGLAAPIGK